MSYKSVKYKKNHAFNNTCNLLNKPHKMLNFASLMTAEEGGNVFIRLLLSDSVTAGMQDLLDVICVLSTKDFFLDV